ncbi:MAG: carbon-monoxide dehydrogenase catalytic subunit [Lentisphaerae bacterium RIFOXYB12_FULL_65_16]|nr:MAG: carbon-monoxide dehydrogenase catalytic subunit [Lentisphaerae bacterium RIFOXYA12_64_32]OGV91127.1 MAG: carbon-monoxide dehydrogenase catalytic subunit [Lentisphaerae bacterium RIFOXYB12_FULL_65_16]
MTDKSAKTAASIDPAALAMIEKLAAQGVETAFDRHVEQGTRCPFGDKGVCCRICDMGPCRISLKEKGAKRGICGATASTIAARQLIRQVAAGVAAHSDHGHDIVKTLKLAAKGDAQGYTIKGVDRLMALAKEWGVKTDQREVKEIALELADLALGQFNQQEGEIRYPAMRAPEATVKNWRRLGLIPVGVEHEIVETLHRTHEGVDADYMNLIMHGLRTSLGDGWGGAMLATDFGDILFGSPMPVRSQVNLGVLKEDHVNIVVHGHEPTLSEMVVAASRDAEMLALAKQKGAQGILVGGICCTANEILMRQGAPVVGNFLHQELALATGAVDVMLVDVQCIMPAVIEHAARFHTKVITTSKKAKIPGATHVQFDEEHAYDIAKSIVRTAVENYPNRKGQDIPPNKTDLVAGFTVQNTFWHLGGRYRSTFRPLNDGIISGRLRGVAAVIGCNNVRKVQDDSHLKMVKELLKNDVLVVMTGCAATACAKYGLLQPEAAAEYAGQGLREICEAVGLPPVLHLGSCVDNSRILVALCEMSREGGLGDKLSDLPIAGAAPEAMCEKAIAIGFYCVASGAYVNYSPAMKVLGSPELTQLLTEGLEDIVGGKFSFEEDPVKAAQLMMRHMDKKRKALKLRPLMYAKSFLDEESPEPAAAVSTAAAQISEPGKKGCGGVRP